MLKLSFVDPDPLQKSLHRTQGIPYKFSGKTLIARSEREAENRAEMRQPGPHRVMLADRHCRFFLERRRRCL